MCRTSLYIFLDHEYKAAMEGNISFVLQLLQLSVISSFVILSFRHWPFIYRMSQQVCASL